MRLFSLCVVISSSSAQIEPAAYDEGLARLYVQYARASFCTKSAITEWSCGDACQTAPVIDGTVKFIGPGKEYKVQAYAAAVPDSSRAERNGSRHCVLAFRGSIDPMNWYADAKVFTVPWPENNASWCLGCKVHNGFVDAFAELRSEMYSAIEKLQCTKLAVTGHSLGAAIATLASMELRRTTQLAVGPVFVFGSPRVGNPAFVDAYIEAAKAQKMEPPLWRVVHYHDPVPRLAPRGEPFNYVHVPREVYYSTEAEDVYQVCDTTGEDPECGDSVWLWRCLDLDHLTYLNKSFAHREREAACVGSNLTAHNDVVMVV